VKKSKRALFIGLGIISLVLAYIGVALPGIPGTPFIILTAFFFIRSSDRLYYWLLRNRLFARIISKFNGEEKLGFKTKLLFLVPVWISAVVADLLFVERWQGHLTVGLLITAYTVLILLLKKFPHAPGPVS